MAAVLILYPFLKPYREVSQHYKHVRTIDEVRSGGYYEPTRFRSTKGRMHGTFGVDVRLFRWDVFRIWPEDYLWQLSAAVDFARDYKVFSAGIGGWY